jgi:hypothetical protein
MSELKLRPPKKPTLSAFCKGGWDLCAGFAFACLTFVQVFASTVIIAYRRIHARV